MRTFICDLGLFILLIFSLNWIFVGFYERADRASIANKTNFQSQQYSAIHDESNKFSIIFLGSSRGYSAFVPHVFDSITGMRSYNMCTGAQSIIESYFILKEVLHHQQPKIIVYETFLPCFDRSNDYYHILWNAYFMGYKDGFDMLVNGFGAEGIIHFVFPALKYIPRWKAMDFRFNGNNVNDSPNIIFGFDQGHIVDHNVVDAETIATFPRIYSLDNTPLSTRKIDKFLPAFIKLCKENNIKLICVTVPYPPSRLHLSPEDNASEYFGYLFKNHNVPYIDMNYLDENEFKNSDSYFSDHHHLNHKGAITVSKTLADTLAKL